MSTLSIASELSFMIEECANLEKLVFNLFLVGAG